MRVVVVNPPQPIVSLPEAKRQLRVEHDDDDELITDLIAAATATIDGPGGWLGRALGEQTLELRACRSRELPYPPVISVTSVKYLDRDLVEQTFDPAGYELVGQEVWLKRGVAFPSVAGREDAVRIRYVAGWPMVGDRWTGPAPIRLGVLLMVGRLYASRGEDRPANLVEDTAADRLLAFYRVWTL